MGALENGLRILSALDRGQTRLAVSDLARRLGLPKSGVSRTLRQLADAGFVERDPDGRHYRPGYELFRLGALYKSGELPVDLADRGVSALVERFPATGYVAALAGADAVILRLREGTHPLRYVLAEGTRLPACLTAIGKAMLSRLGPAELETLLPPALSHPPLRYHASRGELIAELSTYRDRGWAELKDQAFRGIDAVAVAVRPPGAPPLGMALCYLQAAVAGADVPAAAVPTADVAAMVEALRQLAREVAAPAGDGYWSVSAPAGAA